MLTMSESLIQLLNVLKKQLAHGKIKPLDIQFEDGKLYVHFERLKPLAEWEKGIYENDPNGKQN